MGNGGKSCLLTAGYCYHWTHKREGLEGKNKRINIRRTYKWCWVNVTNYVYVYVCVRERNYDIVSFNILYFKESGIPFFL